jgi:hemoglobin
METVMADEDRQSTSGETITLYEAIGGDATVRALAARFYELMDTLPEAARCRAVHPQSLAGSEAKFYDYLTGYLGGPPVYVEKHGHPRLRSRHFGAAIGPVERDEWLLCFRRAMDETIASPALRDIIWPPIERLAHHMQNRE